jgi:Raf kinase inhibitor-like YbhB/YbcL family protein
MRVRLGSATRAFVGSAALGVVLVLAACGEDSPAIPSADGGSSSGTSGDPGADSGSTTPPDDGGSSGNPDDSGSTDSGGNQDAAGSFTLTSTAYAEGGMIPEKHECTNGGGQNASPPLAWSGAPAGTQSYAIVMRDLDFQNGFIHWVIWDIPGNLTSLPEDIEHVYEPATPAGAKQARFNQAIRGYQGPCSPNSVNTYEVTLYAIPTATMQGLNQATSKAQAATAIVGAAIASTKLAGES